MWLIFVYDQILTANFLFLECKTQLCKALYQRNMTNILRVNRKYKRTHARTNMLIEFCLGEKMKEKSKQNQTEVKKTGFVVENVFSIDSQWTTPLTTTITT